MEDVLGSCRNGRRSLKPIDVVVFRWPAKFQDGGRDFFFYGSASTWPSADVHGRAIYRLRLSSSGFISFELLLSLSLTISYVQPRRNVGHRQRKVGNQNKIKKKDRPRKWPSSRNLGFFFFLGGFRPKFIFDANGNRTRECRRDSPPIDRPIGSFLFRGPL